MRIYYRSAQVMHIVANEAFQFLLQTYIVVGDLLFLIMLFVFVCNLSPVTFNALLSGMVAAAYLLCWNLAFGCAAKINDSSRSISKTVTKATKEEKAILKSFKPMGIRIGDTFTITSKSFVNALDHILSNLVNLLVTFN